MKNVRVSYTWKKGICNGHGIVHTNLRESQSHYFAYFKEKQRINIYAMIFTFKTLHGQFGESKIHNKSSLVAQLVKNLPAVQGTWVGSLGWKDPWRRKWQPILVPLPGKSHGQRNPVGCGPRGRKELGMTEQLTLTNLVERIQMYLLRD